MPNYYKMVEEIAELVDGGMNFDEALEEVKEKHHLDDEETEHLADEYWGYCCEEETDDDFSTEEEIEIFSEEDDFLREDIDARF